MKKSDFFKTLLNIGLASVPGGGAAKDAIVASFHHDDDPTNDIDENANHIADAVVKSFMVAEGLAEKDIVNEAAILAIKANVASALKLIPLVVVKKAA